MRIFAFALMVIGSLGSLSSALAQDNTAELENDREQAEFYAKLNGLVLEGVDANDLKQTDRGSTIEVQTLTQQVTRATR